MTVYFTPGYFQLKALIKGVRETVLILDVKAQIYYYCYYANTKSDKAIGYMSNKCKVNSSSHYLVMSLFSLPNIPCTFVKVQEDETSGNLTLDCERFVKHT